MSNLITLHIFKDDYTAEESWRLLAWCMERGGDEFSINCLGADSCGDDVWNEFVIDMHDHHAGEQKRLMLSGGNGGGAKERPTLLWKLNDSSVSVLREYFRTGIFDRSFGEFCSWIEDLHVFREGKLMLGIVTSDAEGVLVLSTEEAENFKDFNFSFHLKGKKVGAIELIG